MSCGLEWWTEQYQPWDQPDVHGSKLGMQSLPWIAFASVFGAVSNFMLYVTTYTALRLPIGYLKGRFWTPLAPDYCSTANNQPYNTLYPSLLRNIWKYFAIFVLKPSSLRTPVKPKIPTRANTSIWRKRSALSSCMTSKSIKMVLLESSFHSLLTLIGRRQSNSICNLSILPNRANTCDT